MRGNGYLRYSWSLLVYTVVVILWGAYVRATGAGAGCGNHWPDCNGEVLPRPERIETLIEFTHRASSGLMFVGALVLLIWALRALPVGHLSRRFAGIAMGFTIAEVAVGALLVLARLVADDQSTSRAVVLAIHLVNTFMLVASLALTAWFATDGRVARLKGKSRTVGLVALALGGVVLLGVSGAIAALGDTLFPAGSLAEGLRQDMSPTAHFLIQLRILHPMIAVITAIFVSVIVGVVSRRARSSRVKLMSRWVIGLFVLELAAGFVNLVLLAPLWMQMLHLLLADAVWIAMVLFSASALAPLEATVEDDGGLGAATWREYVALTKPRVISLLLFTTLTAMVIAARSWPGTFKFLIVALGGYMAAGAANAINMVIDRDIDVKMARTASRPTVTQRIPAANALLFAFALAAGSFAMLWWEANLLTALLAQAGLVFYVVVYTLLLKRRTWSNIVIGGAAGAFPPLVGWAAVSGELDALAWILFAIIFVWTPVHFWALALLIKDEYAQAGIPMLPVVAGDRVTVVQIGCYAVLTVVVSALPLLLGEVGLLYVAAAGVLNAVLLLRSLQLYQAPDNRPRAVSLFKYSMVYLALLFLIMAVDRAMWA